MTMSTSAERVGMVVAVLTLCGLMIGAYTNILEANAQHEVRITAVEQRAKEIDKGVDATRRDLQSLKTNTVLICNKLQIDRCK